MKRVKQFKTEEIQKEQLFLVQLERELNNVLGKIDEHLNTLKVEELQLRSNAVNNLNGNAKEESPKVAEIITKEEWQPTFNENPQLVNQQELDLDIYLSHFNEEEVDD